MALPDGTIIVTDKFVELVERDEEFQAILAHEIGHVKNRHTLKKVLATSSVAILISAYLGDATELATLLTISPTTVLNAHYSRDYERDADLFALKFFQGHQIDPIHFANIMTKISGKHANDPGNLLSTHPATPERVKRFEDASKSHNMSVDGILKKYSD